jgi:hypothetical protein
MTKAVDHPEYTLHEITKERTMTVIDNHVIENFFESLQNTEKDFLIFEGFEHYMEKVQGQARRSWDR